MGTQCEQTVMEFQGLKNRRVEAAFDGGRITRDGGGLLLREVEERWGIIERFAACFRDHRKRRWIEHTVGELVAQRVYALALGYEDLNDHDDLRRDALLATLAGKADPTGGDRVHERDRGKALAGKSTLNRLELTAQETDGSDRYKKIELDPEAANRFFVEAFLEAHEAPPARIILDPVYLYQTGNTEENIARLFYFRVGLLAGTKERCPLSADVCLPSKGEGTGRIYGCEIVTKELPGSSFWATGTRVEGMNTSNLSMFRQSPMPARSKAKSAVDRYGPSQASLAGERSAVLLESAHPFPFLAWNANSHPRMAAFSAAGTVKSSMKERGAEAE